MAPDKIFDLYEKLYFHEVSVKEQIAARLQIPLAILVSIVSVYAYLLQNVDFKYSLLMIFFIVSFILSFSLFLVACFHFVSGFYGHTYEMLPTANETENYRKTLTNTYSEYEEGSKLVDKYFSEYLCNYYAEISSANTKVNDKRSEDIHKTNTFIILSLPLIAVSFLIFVFGGIDKNSVEKTHKVLIDNPIVLEGYPLPTRNMIEVTVVNDPNQRRPLVPPPPPPPPGKRYIKEDVEIPFRNSRDEQKRENEKRDRK